MNLGCFGFPVVSVVLLRTFGWFWAELGGFVRLTGDWICGFWVVGWYWFLLLFFDCACVVDW